MAKCERGYLCDVCGEEVAEITDSELYLRFVIGEIRAQQLLSAKERHIRCHPVQAQYIVDAEFETPVVESPLGKQNLDTEYVRQREELVTRGWKRLRELPGSGLPFSDYPLPEFRAHETQQP